MKKEVIIVPKDKCPMDVLAEIGEQLRNSWIFLHENAYQNLLWREGATSSATDRLITAKITLIVFEATEEYPETRVFCEVPPANGWSKITCIDAEDIAYGLSPNDPKDIFFLKMEE